MQIAIDFYCKTKSQDINPFRLLCRLRARPFLFLLIMCLKAMRMAMYSFEDDVDERNLNFYSIMYWWRCKNRKNERKVSSGTLIKIKKAFRRFDTLIIKALPRLTRCVYLRTPGI